MQGRISHLTALTHVREPGPKGGPVEARGGPRGPRAPGPRPKITFLSKSVNFRRALCIFTFFNENLRARSARSIVLER